MEYLGGKLGGPCARRAHASAQSLGNEHLIVVHGGQDEASMLLDDMWLYDARRALWSKVEYQSDEVPPGRTMHTLVSYLPGKFLLYGGLALGNEEELDDCWTFDIVDAKWNRIEPGGETPGKRGGHTAVVGGSGMYLRGGQETGDNDTVYRLDLHVWKWEKLNIADGPKPVPRESSSACWIPQCNCLLIAFGQQANVENEVYCNDIWALAKGNKDVWRWFKVQLKHENYLRPRIEASMILLPGLKPRVLVWGGLIPETEGFADDYLIIDLHEMSVKRVCRPDWPHRMLHSAFRVGPEFLVFGGIHLEQGMINPVAAPNRMERFRISYETLYDKKRSECIRVRVERANENGALLSAVVDGQVYLANITNEMVKKAKMRRAEVVKEESSDIEMNEDEEVTPADKIVGPDTVQSLAMTKKPEKIVQGNSGCTNSEVVRTSAPKRQRVGTNSASSLGKGAQATRNYVGLGDGNGVVQEKRKSSSDAVGLGRARIAVASPIAPPTKMIQKTAAAASGQTPKHQQTKISFTPSKTKANPPPIVPPKLHIQSRTVSTAPPKQSSTHATVITRPKTTTVQASAAAPLEGLQAHSSAIAPPRDGPSIEKSNVSNNLIRPPDAPRKPIVQASLSVIAPPLQNAISVAPKQNSNSIEIGRRDGQALVVENRHIDSQQSTHSNKLSSAAQPATKMTATSAVVAQKPQTQLTTFKTQSDGQLEQSVKENVSVPSEPKAHVQAVAPSFTVDSTRVSAIAMPKRVATVETKEIQVEMKPAVGELIEDSPKKVTATDVEMISNTEHDEQMVAAEPVPDDLDELEDLDDDLEPINYDPPSEAELAAATAQMERGTEERMEVVIACGQQEQQLADDEIEQVEAPKSPEVITIE